jgi:hypothetical protein
LFIHGQFGHKWLKLAVDAGHCFKENFLKPQKFVIPAKAGIQSLVYSRTWNGLDPRLRGDDRFLEVAQNKTRHKLRGAFFICARTRATMA